MQKIKGERVKSIIQIFSNLYNSKNSKASSRMINNKNVNIFTQQESYSQKNFNKEEKSQSNNGMILSKNKIYPFSLEKISTSQY